MTTRCLAVLLALTSVASADATVATDGGEPSEKTPPRRMEGRIGMLIGGADVGDADGFSAGVSVGLGYRINDITVRGKLDYFRTGDGGGEPLSRSGRSTRLALAGRYSFVNNGDDSGLGLDFWGEAGIGIEHVAWRPGGVLDRPSGELAIGFELDARGSIDDDRGRRRHVGYFMDFRSIVGQGPEMDGPAVCGGPCTRATKPSRVDITMFFEFGLHWGR